MMFQNEEAQIAIGTMDIPPRKRPCLVVREGNHVRKLASFDSEIEAITFCEKLAAFLGKPNPYFSWDDKEDGGEG